MRTTLSLDQDVAAEVERMRRDDGIGLSEAVNTLIRRGLVAPRSQPTYEHRPASLGLRVDVTDIGAVLDLLDDV